MTKSLLVFISIRGLRRPGVNVALGLALILAMAVVTAPSAQAQSFTLLYNFAGAPDGAVPSGVVQDAAGNLYGTTQQGGITVGVCTNTVAGMSGCGTVFKLDPSGAETVLYKFTRGADGAFPTAGLVRDTAGNLYGSTSAAVFKLDTAGKFTVLHSPGAYAGLVMDAAGNLYGSSSEGIFKLDAAGKFTVLDSNDSSGATLARDAAGNLYGTTEFGGVVDAACLQSSCGTVFKLDTAGAYTVLHSFTPVGNDGYNPVGGLVLDAAGNLYGTASSGGSLNCLGGRNTPTSCGIVFRLSPAGVETVYNFNSGGGEAPNGGLVQDTAGNLYGTTEFTGPHAGTDALLFEMTPSGAETVLFSFVGGGLNRTVPTGSLILDAAGNLYGTTPSGGAGGAGSVFKFNPTGAPTFPFDVAPAGTGTGTVTGTAGGIHCQFSCTGFYPPGTAITLTPTAAAGSTFTGWTGGCNSTAAICHVNTGSAEVVVWSVFDLDFSVSASALTPATVSPGGSSTSTVNVNPLSSFSGSVVFTCSVQPAPALAPTCSVSPSSAVPGIPVILTVRTTGPTAGARSPLAGNELFVGLSLPLVALAFAGIGFGPEQNRRNWKYTAGVLTSTLFAVLVFQLGCAGGSANLGGGAGGGSSGTPAGTYTITVTGTYTGTYPSGTLVHSVPTMLTVQ